MLIDMHIHTKEISSCSSCEAKVMIDRYASKGYDAVVITNHLNMWSRGRREKSWEEFIRSYAAVIKEAAGYAKQYGIRVFMGCELRFNDGANDYLVYGMTEEFMLSHPEIVTVNNEQLHALAKENGFLVYQAHPFRDGMKVVNPKHLDGVEVGNGHRHHNSRNDFAKLWADAYGLRTVCGSDFHHDGDEGTGGMIFFEDIQNEKELVEALKSGNYLMVSNHLGGLIAADGISD